MEEQQKLDLFTKRYLGALFIAAVVLLLWWLSGLDFRVGELNDTLRADPELAAYPYQFEVMSLQDGVATVSSPRSAQVPALLYLRIVYPELNNASVTDDSMMAAQEALAAMQARAGEIVISQDDVQSVRWVIDSKWYAYHGVYLD